MEDALHPHIFMSFEFDLSTFFFPLSLRFPLSLSQHVRISWVFQSFEKDKKGRKRCYYPFASRSFCLYKNGEFKMEASGHY